MSSPPPLPQGGGLPHFQQSFTPAAGNHPLAQPPVVPPPTANHSLEACLPDANAALQYSMPPPPATANYQNFPLPRGNVTPHPNQYTSTAPMAIPPNNNKGNSPNAASPAQSLDDLVDTFLSGPCFRTQLGLPPLLRPPPLVNEDPLQCLRTLVERRAWGDVLQVTADLLRGADSIYAPIYSSMLFRGNNNNSGGTSTQLQHETAEIVALQCHAWLKLRRYTDLGQEIEQWNFLPFNENYNENKMPKWIPWSLHIIAAETLLHTTDDPHRGTDELHAVIGRIPDSEDVRWKLCTFRALANAFSRKREWRLAMVSLERILPLIDEATKLELATSGLTKPKATLLAAAYRTEVLSVQGRYLLHAGAVAEASEIFQEAQRDWTKIKSDVGASAAELDANVVVQHIPAQLLANEGLLCFAYANYEHAIECFGKATDALRKLSLEPVYRSEDWVGPTVVGVSPHPSLFNECINNMAISALYTCRMPEAVNLMESLVREDPTAFLTERVAFNLCTMYELGCDSTASARKKRVLQLVAKRFFLHDVGPESFRIN